MDLGQPESSLGPWDRKRVRASLEIERAGLALLVERGLDQVTVEQVAARAGISVRTFFRYFRNVPDLVTRVPQREVGRICRVVALRPASENLLDAFRAAVQEEARGSAEGDYADLTRQNLERWTAIVRADSDRMAELSHALTVMTRRFTDVISVRLGLEADRDLTAGALGAGLAGVVWFAYLTFVASDGSVPLAIVLDTAFGRLAELFRGAAIGQEIWTE